MNYIKFKGKKTNTELESQCFCYHDMGIWSRRNGLEWEYELDWKQSSVIKQIEYPSYRFAISKKHSLKLEVEEFNHEQHTQKLYLRKITLHNESKKEQNIKLFFQQDYNSENGTVFFRLTDRTLYHESQGRYMLINGSLDSKGITQYTTYQKKEHDSLSFLDVNTGALYYNPISSGSVKSAFSLETAILPYEIKHGYYWFATGQNINEVNSLNEVFIQDPKWLVKEFVDSNSSRLIRLFQ